MPRRHAPPVAPACVPTYAHLGRHVCSPVLLDMPFRPASHCEVLTAGMLLTRRRLRCPSTRPIRLCASSSSPGPPVDQAWCHLLLVQSLMHTKPILSTLCGGTTVSLPRGRSAKAYPLDALMADCRDFFSLTGRRVSFEYTLMAGVNDGAEQVLCVTSV